MPNPEQARTPTDGAIAIVDSIRFDELVDWLKGIQDKDDHALVLLGTARLDDELLRLIDRKLVNPISKAEESEREDLFKDRGPFGTFSARTKACFALGLISGELAGEIDRLRKLRNKAAHTWSPVSLNAEPFAGLCKSLYAPTYLPMYDEPRMRFIFATSLIIAKLIQPFGFSCRERRPVPDSMDFALMAPQKLEQVMSKVKDLKLQLDPEIYDVERPGRVGIKGP